MNTKYTTTAGMAKKKNPNAGRSDLLKGYTVGSLAPPGSVSSGTTIKQVGTTYGINSRFGNKAGKASKGEPKAASSSGGVSPTVIFSVLSALVLLAGAAPK